MVRNAGAPVRAGDTIWLRSGFHGALSINRYYNTDNITLAAEEGHVPLLSSVRIRSGAHWTLRGLTVSAELGETYERRTLIDLDSHSWHGPVHDVVVEECTLRSVADAAVWTAADWDQLACSGIQVDGTRMTIRGNHLLNVNFGISVTASDSLIRGNVVENFAGDGLRGLGDRCTFEYNTVKNCYDVNANHDDGFQSWSVGPNGVGSGEVVGDGAARQHDHQLRRSEPAAPGDAPGHRLLRRDLCRLGRREQRRHHRPLARHYAGRGAELSRDQQHRARSQRRAARTALDLRRQPQERHATGRLRGAQ